RQDQVMMHRWWRLHCPQRLPVRQLLRPSKVGWPAHFCSALVDLLLPTNAVRGRVLAPHRITMIDSLMTSYRNPGLPPNNNGHRLRCFLFSTLNFILIPLMTLIWSQPIAKAQDPVSAGKASFERVCGLCHGPQGRGGIGPALVPMTHESDEVLDIAREGRGMMPAIS